MNHACQASILSLSYIFPFETGIHSVSQVGPILSWNYRPMPPVPIMDFLSSSLQRMLTNKVVLQ